MSLDLTVGGGDTILDTFAGSGTTIIACEKMGRRARVIELDPRYCDVAVRRRQEYTGREATLEGRCATFLAMAAERLPVEAAPAAA